MKQVQFSHFGAPHEVSECVEVAEVGEPGIGEAVVDIEAFPINPADLLTISGGYASKPPLPATLGAEGIGKVRAVGAGVTNVAVGNRVILLGRDNWTQQRRVPSEQLVKVSRDADPLQLAMLKVNPATAYLMLTRYVALEPGDWVIQDAANSGVGNNLIRLAAAEGIKTINVVRREELIAPLEQAGANVVVVDGDDLAERVTARTEGAVAKLAIDAVAGDMCIRLADCLADGGTVVNYGLLSGDPCMLRADQTVFKGITLTGFWLAKVLREMPPAEVAALYADLGARVEDGRLKVDVEATYAIDDIKAALEHAGRSGRSGKILVTPNGSL